MKRHHTKPMPSAPIPAPTPAPAPSKPTQPDEQRSACVVTAAPGLADIKETTAAPLNAPDPAQLRMTALSGWDNEGGAYAQTWPATLNDPLLDGAPLTNAESMQFRVRMIALENLVIALLAEAPARQLDLVREMATYISPRPGYTPHPLTLRAADEMLSLVDRAVRYASSAP